MGSLQQFTLARPVLATAEIKKALRNCGFRIVKTHTQYRKIMKKNEKSAWPVSVALIKGNKLIYLYALATNVVWKEKLKKSARKAKIRLSVYTVR